MAQAKRAVGRRLAEPQHKPRVHPSPRRRVHPYAVSVRGSVPADLNHRIAGAHAAAISARRPSLRRRNAEPNRTVAR